MDRLNTRLGALAIFRPLLSDPVVSALREYLSARQQGDVDNAVSAYGEFASRLYGTGGSLGAHIRDIMGDSENVYIRTIGRGETPPEFMVGCAENELETLQLAAGLTPEDLREGLDWGGFLPGFNTEKVDLAASYRYRIDNIGKFGYGVYAQHRMFYIDQQNHIVPVQNPDATRLEALVDYEREQKIILDNTRALLDGKPAANILLTGDAGTGKSSTVKAVVNELYRDGLRILEVRKEQLREIPAILDELTMNPLKFILFIDDLSFQKDDDNYSALKAVLEGSVSAKSQNVVIYATSNRRHLVKEKFSDREGDDVHANDTMQEIISLSERFGIHVTFQRPDKKTYLDIVHHLAEEAGIKNPTEELEAEAEKFALGRGGRSARAARQFIDRLLSQKN